MMTKNEILSFFREAQELQAASFMVKKVSLYINTDYCHCTSHASFSVSLFYGKSNILLNFHVADDEDIAKVRESFNFAKAIIGASENIETETE